MSGLIHGLVINAKALGAHSASAETAGRNLANVNNADYARQRVITGSRGSAETRLGAQSYGLEALSIEHIRDAVLDAQMLREKAARASLESQEKAAFWIESNLGEQINRQESLGEDGGESAVTTGLSKAISDFFNSFEALASRPTDDGEKQELMQQAATLVERFNTIDSRLAEVGSNIDREIAAGVGEVNRILEGIADLNGQISRFELRLPNSAVDLRDKRQALLDELSEHINFEASDIPGSTGQIRVTLREAGSLAPIDLIKGDRVESPVTFDGSAFQVFAGGTSLSVTSGSLHGFRETRDTLLADTRTGLDALAGQLVNRVNTAYNALPPAADFFDASGTTAGSIALDTGLDIANLKVGESGLAGDNRIALGVAAAGDTRYSGGGFNNETFSQFMARLTAGVGSTVASVGDRLTNQKAVEDMIETQRQSVSGVSMDEEMSDLLRFQRAFQGTARVVNTLDSMLELVVTGLGR